MISALIRTFNSAKTLEQTLASVAAQETRPDEIIIVDSGSTDATLEIVARFGCRLIAYPTGGPFNYSRSLNIGAAACGGEYILILSSHCVLVYPDAVQLMVANLRALEASGAYCIPTHPDTVAASREDPLRGKLTDVIYSDNYNGSNGLWNCCSMIRRDCWEAHPFDESLPACEDQEWALWHYRHTGRPTVAIRNAGVIYLNPHMGIRKQIRDRIVIGTRIWPEHFSWRAIADEVVDGLFAVCRLQPRAARDFFRVAFALAASRFRRR